MDSTRSASTDEPSRRLIDTTPLPMALLTASGAIEHLNPKFLETFGYTASELPDLDAWWPLAYPDAQYRAEVVKTWCGRLGSVRAGEELPPFRARVTCRDGRVREIEWRGTLLGPHVLVVGADQTEPQRALEALRASDQRYRVLLETAPEAIVVYDVDRRLFVDSNPAAERIFQCSREELHRYGPAELSPATQPGGLPSPEAAAAAADATWFEVLSWQGSHDGSDGGMVRSQLVRQPDGSYVTDRAVPIDGSGKTILRLHTGTSLQGIPIYLPDDPGIPAPEVAAVDGVRRFTAEKHILQREARTDNVNLERGAYVLLLGLAILWMAVVSWSLVRIERPPSPSQRRGAPGERRRAALRPTPA